MSTNFESVPVIDYTLLKSPDTRPEFITQLRHALIDVGFLYLLNPPVASEDVSRLVDYIPRLFDELSQEQKDAIAMVNSAQFLGYSRLGTERTKERTDMREQFDFATPYQCPWKEGDPEYLRLWGGSQWPEEKVLPGFRETMEAYLAQVETLSYEFIRLIAEALGLPSNALDVFYQSPRGIQHRSKIVKYPTLDSVSDNQGVGPHYDAGFLTFLLQASNHAGLQVQNVSGKWIDVPPIPNTFVINIGKGLDSVTQGLARATSHRVLSPPKGSTPRYSVPFFQNIAQDARVRSLGSQIKFSDEILALKERRGQGAQSDSVNFSEYDHDEPSGHVNLIGRIKSHPDVARRHYPALFSKYFPEGHVGLGNAY